MPTAYKVKSKPEPKPGSHEEDIKVSAELLEEAREKGHAYIPKTVDGDIDIFYDKGKRLYHVNQYVDGKLVSHPSVLRRIMQAYIIDLRERRRKEDKKRKRKAKA